MLGIFANYHYAPLALDDLTLLAHGLNGRSYFHTVEPPYENEVSNLLLASPCDPTSCQIVRRHLYGYLVTGQDLNKVHSELAGNGCQNGVAVTQIYLKHCVGQVVGNDALNLDYVVFCQVVTLLGHYFAFLWQ